jgi:hypothetical protein
MVVKRALMLVLAVLPLGATAGAAWAAPVQVSPDDTSRTASAGVPAESRAGPAPAVSGALATRFAQPEQTVEYHFMIEIPALAEADLTHAFETSVVEPLKRVVEVGVLGRCKPAVYLDSRGNRLEGHNLIVRVREGRITIKARSTSPTNLLDLERCASGKYEVDRFEAPEYSISSDVDYWAGELDVRSPALAPAAVWAAVERHCPGLWRQLLPVIEDAGRIEIPGVAHMYDAGAVLKHPAGVDVKEAGVSAWFFPPTGKFLVELAFTGYERDRPGLERVYRELSDTLRAAGLLRADQSSKTHQYFAAYFGRTAVRPRPGTRQDGRPR